jgi:thiol-disulfide isomerase/thioredoxin
MYIKYLAAFVFLFLSNLASAGDFSFQDLDGKRHTLSGYKGKWVLVNFWATWCPPCLEEMPDLIKLHDKHHKTDLVVLGVAMDYRNAATVKEFAEQMLVTYPIILGTKESAAQVGPINGLPTTYLFDPQGKKVAYQVGLITREAVESYMVSKKK